MESAKCMMSWRPGGEEYVPRLSKERADIFYALDSGEE